MKINRLILLASALMMASACLEGPEAEIIPQVGKEVQFGLSLGDGVKTRTVYGDETSTGFPIYWVNGDQVLIASPQCLDGRNSARYQVACSTSVQTSANSLTKVGDAGVQWGEVDNGEDVRFYSIYPAVGNKLEIKGGNISATFKVASTQYAEISASSDGATIYAQPADMGNVIMYASATGKYGEPVSLTYKPFSTVIEFTTQTPGFAAGNQPLTIQSLTLTAPSNGPDIAGDFEFDFDGPSIKPIVETGKKSITVHFLENNEYTLKINKQQLVKIKMCVMPTDQITSLEGWTVVLATSAGNFTKILAAKDQNGGTTSLAPGKVHKIVLPALSFANQEWVYEDNNWITSIPDYKKVYLTELSLPGAWYARHSASDNYQKNGDDIEGLWNAGIRAFALETKTRSQESSYSADETPDAIILSGTGDNSYREFNGGYNSLHSQEGEDGKVYRNGTQLREIIKDIADCITPEEYGVLVLSYGDGGNGVRYVDFGAWLNLLYKEFEALSSQIRSKIYQDEITENTIIEDVQGKLIIKVNVDANIAFSGSVGNTTYTYGNNFPALFSYNPFVLQLGDFTNPHFSKLYWKTWADIYRESSTTLASDTGFTWCFSSANRTQPDNGTNNTVPTYENRQAALTTMMQKSKEIYEASTHNVWFYFNCGGLQAASSTATSNTSATAFADVMNDWLLELIKNKNNTEEASPLGIVMFNRCTDTEYDGPEIIAEIIKMNSKFYLKHEGDYDFERPVTEFDNSHVGVDSWDTGFIQ